MTKLVDKIGQFTTVPNSFIEQTAELSHAAFRLFVALRYYTNSKTDAAFPSYDTLRELTGMERRTIAKAIKDLKKGGWIEAKRRFGKSTIYTLNIPASSGKTATTVEEDSSSKTATISSGKDAIISSGSLPYANQTEINQTEINQTERAHTQATPPPVYSKPDKAPPDDLPAMATVATITAPEPINANRPMPSTKHPLIQAFFREFEYYPTEAQTFEILDRVSADRLDVWKSTLHDFHINEPQRYWTKVGWMCDRYQKALQPKPQQYASQPRSPIAGRSNGRTYTKPQVPDDTDEERDAARARARQRIAEREARKQQEQTR